MESHELMRSVSEIIIRESLREMDGPPRPWKANATVQAMAARIAQVGDWKALPILADALEEAGCDAVPFLEHLRSPRHTKRGCVVVDFLLRETR